jgi:hypothetical protein
LEWCRNPTGSRSSTQVITHIHHLFSVAIVLWLSIPYS